MESDERTQRRMARLKEEGITLYNHAKQKSISKHVKMANIETDGLEKRTATICPTPVSCK